MSLDNKKTKELMSAIIKLKNTDEAARFFRDLLTEDEISEFGNRWLAAQLLSQGVPYTKITARTHLSSTTIARVSKWLNNGMDGYKLILKRLYPQLAGGHHTHASPVRKSVV